MMMAMNLAEVIEKAYPAELLAELNSFGTAAAERGWDLFLVGGAVRDLLLSRPSLDLDLTVVGDAIALARIVAQGRKVLSHSRFGTAKLKGTGWSLDLATARKENYPHPGALPRVVPGTLSDDLLRRDFTINAIAVSLAPATWGLVIDPFDGLGDLARGELRVLHPRSFSDDATRILRGIRYEQRFSFRLERETEAWLLRDREMLNTISGDRLRHELERSLAEAYPERVLRRMGELELLPRLGLPLPGNGELAERFAAARESQPAPPPRTESALRTDGVRPGGQAGSTLLYLCLLVYPLTQEQLEIFLKRLNFPRTVALALRDTLRVKESLRSFPLTEMLGLFPQLLRPSHIVRLLEGLAPTAIAAGSFYARPQASQALRLFLTRLRYIKPVCRGSDLVAWGVPTGPALGEMLQRLRDARLDDEVSSKSEEEDLVRRWLTAL